MPEEKKDGVQDLLSAIAGDTADVSHRLYRLFLLEMRMAAQSMCGALAMAVAAIVFAFVAVLFAGEAMFEWLSAELGSRMLAALAVTAFMALIGGALAYASYRRFRHTSFVPKRTRASLHELRAAFFGGPRK